MYNVYVHRVHYILEHLHTYGSPASLSSLELAAFASKEDEGVGSGYESDSESAVSCCTDDAFNSYLGNVYGDSSDLEKEIDRESDLAPADTATTTADSAGLDTLNGGRRETAAPEQSNFDKQREYRMLDDRAVAPGARVQENGWNNVTSSLNSIPLPTVSLTPAGTSDSDMVCGRDELQLLATFDENDRERELSRSVDGVSGSPGDGMQLLDLSDVALQRSGSESSDREDSIFSRSRWKNMLSNSPISDFSPRQWRKALERKETSTGTSERGRGDVPTITLAIVSRRSRHRAGQ